MTSTERLHGAVAAILNRQELVINLGSDNGVTEGMRFAILNRRGVDIKDPNTDELLGSVDVPKVVVEAVRIQPRITVARTFRVTRRNVGGTGSLGIGLSGLFEPPKWVEVRESLRSQEKPAIAELDESESYVKVGDPVVEVRGEEFAFGDPPVADS